MWLNPQKTADLVSFTEEILNRKLHYFPFFIAFLVVKTQRALGIS